MNDEKKAEWLRDHGWNETDAKRWRLPSWPMTDDSLASLNLLDAIAHQRALDAAEERRVECDAFTRTLAACWATQTDAEDAAKTAASVARDWFRSRFGAPEGE